MKTLLCTLITLLILLSIKNVIGQSNQTLEKYKVYDFRSSQYIYLDSVEYRRYQANTNKSGYNSVTNTYSNNYNQNNSYNLSDHDNNSGGATTGSYGASTSSGKVSTGSWNVSTGREGALTGSSESNTGSNYANTGSNRVNTGTWNVSTGTQKATTGVTHSTTGTSKATTSSENAYTGSINANTGREDAYTGPNQVTTGTSKATTSSENAYTGSINANTEREDAYTGSNKVTTGYNSTTGNSTASTGSKSSTGNNYANTGNTSTTGGTIKMYGKYKVFVPNDPEVSNNNSSKKHGKWVNLLNQTNDAIDRGDNKTAFLGIVSLMGYKAAEFALYEAGGYAIKGVGTAIKYNKAVEVLMPSIRNLAAKEALSIGIEGVVNTGNTAILKNGFYEVNGFKFGEIYYNRLWNEGRKAPSLIAKEILERANRVVPDKDISGFYKYYFSRWEMVYNPTTKEVYHLQPIR